MAMDLENFRLAFCQKNLFEPGIIMLHEGTVDWFLIAMPGIGTLTSKDLLIDGNVFRSIAI